ncbi:glucose-6-phosphate dehydrogenase [Falsarthrobacter nasiphocae]|uniref:Glucose-6-phosphate 1-dehydrogenase n=1 Tax=Falsarthrobacter nasiphocae TaxID=189863 RepID=A0AAE4C7T7_9MICC|nr:glucose-6-phosphate dehydrogenase [Falsarthrobacter nasiphocae]MDR6892854.1 glucose-6-phosphate 1-dehydrogenase [Falsarthrobacter nasiphocae]
MNEQTATSISHARRSSAATARTLLILGASGDLTGRLLLPGFAGLLGSGKVRPVRLAGAGSSGYGEEKWQERVRSVFADAEQKATTEGREVLEQVRASTSFHEVDVTAPGQLRSLIDSLEGPVAVYFALPPAVSEKACRLLVETGVPEGTRLVLEKPFGSSAQSARDLNAILAQLVPERDVFRVDHFLGKGTVFNILGLRFANRLLEPVWSNLHIEKVEIFFDEDLALENRAGYYDNAGALRDMIQSHLLQVMALLALNAPASLGERNLRDHIGSLLRAARVKPGYAETTRRARYTAGEINGKAIPSYTDEPGVDPAKNTETLAELEIEINNMRWAGVPFILRSGKALGRRRKEAMITFKPVPHLPTGFHGVDEPTRLRIGFSPETLQLEIDVNGPGDIFTLDRAVLATEMNTSNLLPYGEVLDGVLAGDPLLSVRGDIAEDCWRIVEPVLHAWEAGEVPLEEYPAGSLGPSSWPTSCDGGQLGAPVSSTPLKPTV